MIYLKICCPTTGTRGLDERVGSNIRLVPTFTVVDTDTNVVKVFRHPRTEPDRPGDLAERLSREGTDLVIVVDIDQDQAAAFEKVGIVVYRGAEGNVRNSMEMYDRCFLEPVTNVRMCQQYRYLEEFNGAVY